MKFSRESLRLLFVEVRSFAAFVWKMHSVPIVMAAFFAIWMTTILCFKAAGYWEGRRDQRAEDAQRITDELHRGYHAGYEAAKREFEDSAFSGPK